MSKYLKNDAVKQVARNLIMDAAQREKAKAGRVTMPKVFLAVGSVGFAVMIALAFFQPFVRKITGLCCNIRRIFVGGAGACYCIF